MPSVRPLVGFLQIGLIHGDGELSRTSSPPSNGIYPYGVLWITRRNLWRTPPCCGKRGLSDLPSSNNPVVEGEEMLAEGAKEKRICDTETRERAHRTSSTEEAEEINTYSTERCPASTVDMRGLRRSNDIYSEKRQLDRRYPVFHSSYY